MVRIRIVGVDACSKPSTKMNQSMLTNAVVVIAECFLWFKNENNLNNFFISVYGLRCATVSWCVPLYLHISTDTSHLGSINISFSVAEMQDKVCLWTLSRSWSIKESSIHWSPWPDHHLISQLSIRWKN